MDSALEIFTLSGLAIRRDGEPVVGFDLRNEEALVFRIFVLRDR